MLYDLLRREGCGIPCVSASCPGRTLRLTTYGIGHLNAPDEPVDFSWNAEVIPLAKE